MLKKICCMLSTSLLVFLLGACSPPAPHPILRPRADSVRASSASITSTAVPIISTALPVISTAVPVTSMSIPANDNLRSVESQTGDTQPWHTRPYAKLLLGLNLPLATPSPSPYPPLSEIRVTKPPINGVPYAVLVPFGPPPVLVEITPLSSRSSATWVPGYWFWTGYHWSWSQGAWASPPQPTYYWIPPRYETRSRMIYFIDGYWALQRDRDTSLSFSQNARAARVHESPISEVHLPVTPGPSILPAPKVTYPVPLIRPSLIQEPATARPSTVYPTPSNIHPPAPLVTITHRPIFYLPTASPPTVPVTVLPSMATPSVHQSPPHSEPALATQVHAPAQLTFPIVPTVNPTPHPLTIIRSLPVQNQVISRRPAISEQRR